MNFKLVDRLVIKNPNIDIQETRCFLYDFKGGGFSLKQFTKWLDGKLLDVYEFTGRFGQSRVCPWCKEPLNDDGICICMAFGDRNEDSMNTIKLSNQLYRLLLDYVRNGNYDALSFLMKKECQYCINPVAEGREGLCAIPESARNKPRSMRLLGLEFGNFNFANFSPNAVAILYKRRG